MAQILGTATGLLSQFSIREFLSSAWEIVKSTGKITFDFVKKTAPVFADPKKGTVIALFVYLSASYLRVDEASIDQMLDALASNIESFSLEAVIPQPAPPNLDAITNDARRTFPLDACGWGDVGCWVGNVGKVIGQGAYVIGRIILDSLVFVGWNILKLIIDAGKWLATSLLRYIVKPFVVNILKIWNWSMTQIKNMSCTYLMAVPVMYLGTIAFDPKAWSGGLLGILFRFIGVPIIHQAFVAMLTNNECTISRLIQQGVIQPTTPPALTVPSAPRTKASLDINGLYERSLTMNILKPLVIKDYNRTAEGSGIV